MLIEKGVPCFVRDSRGQDVMAACGQLALLESVAAAIDRSSHEGARLPVCQIAHDCERQPLGMPAV